MGQAAAMIECELPALLSAALPGLLLVVGMGSSSVAPHSLSMVTGW